MGVSDPARPVLRRLLEIVRELTEIRDVREETDIWSLGIDSIDLAEIGERLQQEFGFLPSVDDFFDVLNIDELAALFERHLDTR